MVGFSSQLVLRGCIIIGMSSSYYDLQGLYQGIAPCLWYRKIIRWAPPKWCMYDMFLIMLHRRYQSHMIQ